MPPKNPLTKQAVGAYGEKMVEAELLRRGWIPSNVNASVRNAAEFDVIAQKAARVVLLRVKASGPGQRGFQFSVPAGTKLSVTGLRANDITVLVSMGSDRQDDEFYIVPTKIVRKCVNAHIDEYLAQNTRKGEARKDTGQWVLYLDALKSGEERHSHGYKDKWSKYKDGWALLDHVASWHSGFGDHSFRIRSDVGA